MAPISPDALERWTYRKNGMDYGPFSTKDIYDLVQRHDLDGDTELVNLRTHEKKRVADTARFGAWYRDWLIHEAEQKKRDEVLKEVSKLERVIVRRRIGSLSAEVANVPAPAGPVTLSIVAEPQSYRFLLGDQALAEGETKFLSTEVAGGFTGVYFAMYATGNGLRSSTPADFDWFDYEVVG